jgi:hypothetical protein
MIDAIWRQQFQVDFEAAMLEAGPTDRHQLSFGSVKRTTAMQPEPPFAARELGLRSADCRDSRRSASLEAGRQQRAHSSRTADTMVGRKAVIPSRVALATARQGSERRATHVFAGLQIGSLRPIKVRP